MKRLLVVIALLLIGCEQGAITQESSDILAQGSEASRQLNIYRQTLLSPASGEAIRIDAATELLVSESPLARSILIEILDPNQPKPPILAVCKALIESRTNGEQVQNPDDFIDPLLLILKSSDPGAAKLAAEATLIFTYKEISKQLEAIVTDSAIPPEIRAVSVEALKRPDMDAIFKLMDLLDDPEGAVVKAAEQVLNSRGIPVVGKNYWTREQIRREIKRKGTDKFLREWLIRQEGELNKLRQEVDFWIAEYLKAQDVIYEGLAEEAKGQFLMGHLSNPEAMMRLWALEKVEELRLGTSKLPDELGPRLVELVSDQDRDVRLKTANLLSLMVAINSAEKLLEQFETEEDAQVKAKVFVALGEACYNAFLPSSKIKLNPEIREKTLSFALDYLELDVPAHSRQGAEVVRKLLEQNGIDESQLNIYLAKLIDRYMKAAGEKDNILAGELLRVMAAMCAQGIHKDHASRLFRPLFEEGLDSNQELITEAAVDGLIYIDKTSALKIFIEKGLINNADDIIAEKVIDLAGQVGGVSDLEPLSEKLDDETHAKAAWRAMLKIFSGSQAKIEDLGLWIAKFDTDILKQTISKDQFISFLLIVEQKATAEKSDELQHSAQKRLADLYLSTEDFEKAAAYFGVLLANAETSEEKDALLSKLMTAYIGQANIKAIKGLIAQRLLEKDFSPEDDFITSVDSFLKTEKDSKLSEELLKELASIQLPKPRPVWQNQINTWTNPAPATPAPEKEEAEVKEEENQNK
jgi:hypothetical protein